MPAARASCHGRTARIIGTGKTGMPASRKSDTNEVSPCASERTRGQATATSKVELSQTGGEGVTVALGAPYGGLKNVKHTHALLIHE